MGNRYNKCISCFVISIYRDGYRRKCIIAQTILDGEEGNANEAGVTEFKRLKIDNGPTFYFNVTLGKIPGATQIRKWGFNESVDNGTPADIWDFGDTAGAEIYTFSPGFPGIGLGATANIDTVSSSSATDDQEISIIGLDVDGFEVTQTIILDGQNKATLTTPLWRCYRAWNSDSTDLVGDVYIYVDGAITAGVPNTVTDVRAQIKIGNGQTQMAIYTVPKGITGMFTNIEFSVIKKTSSIVLFQPTFREAGGVFRKAVLASASTDGSSYPQELSPVPEFFPELTDLIIRADSSTIDVGAGASFTLVLLDSEIWGIT